MVHRRRGWLLGSLASSPNVHIVPTLLKGTGNRSNPAIKIDNLNGLPCGTGLTPSYMLDYDRDGKDDIVIACGADNASFFVARSLGDGKFEPVPGPSPTFVLPQAKITFPTPPGARTAPRPGPASPVVIFDVDGDSLQDIVYCPNQYTLRVLRRLGFGLGFGDAVDVPTLPPTKPPRQPGGRPRRTRCAPINSSAASQRPRTSPSTSMVTARPTFCFATTRAAGSCCATRL